MNPAVLILVFAMGVLFGALLFWQIFKWLFRSAWRARTVTVHRFVSWDEAGERVGTILLSVGGIQQEPLAVRVDSAACADHCDHE